LSFVGIPQELQTADNENCLALHALDLARGWLTSSGIDGLTIASALDIKSIFLFPMLLSASQNFQALHGVFFLAYLNSFYTSTRVQHTFTVTCKSEQYNYRSSKHQISEPSQRTRDPRL
jgi:hypothetical protein